MERRQYVPLSINTDLDIQRQGLPQGRCRYHQWVPLFTDAAGSRAEDCAVGVASSSDVDSAYRIFGSSDGSERDKARASLL